ncbi:MAG: hypothetical protein PWP51_1271 [Clostridiales bacterium]|jgi:uncharacterized repeat protein (TIGR04076 family)|nr:hypothetical protein [Clostridiales bacterium]MDN5298718.1 hypothetical protein [Clostridiales bacterium]
MNVKLTIVNSCCRSGYHKTGETYIVGDICPPICHELWHVAYPNILVLQNGGTLDSGCEKLRKFEVKCPDEGRVTLCGEVIA